MGKKPVISIYTRNGRQYGSSYYRIIQYFDDIEQYDIKFRITAPDFISKRFLKASKGVKGSAVKVIYYFFVYILTLLYMTADLIHKPDVIIILRSVTPKTFVFPLKQIYTKLVLQGKILWDFDDNIVVSKEISDGEFQLLAEHSAQISVTNTELNGLIPEQFKHKVVLLPTTDGDFRSIDTESVRADREQSFNNEIVLVWVGSGSNIQYVDRIVSSLDEAAEEVKSAFGKRMTLKVVCNIPANQSARCLKIENIVWSREAAIKAMEEAHIGLMPLIDSAFTRGKGGFKIVQYFALGLPTIASSVGFNKEIITNGVDGYLVDDSQDTGIWKEAIIDLIKTRQHWVDMSIKAKQKWESKFDYEHNRIYWVKTIDSMLGR